MNSITKAASSGNSCNGFAASLSLGEKYEQELDAVFSKHFVIELATKQQQRQGIDRIFLSKDGGNLPVEYKSDFRAYKTGNAFIETVSVDTKGILGWAYTSQATALIYYIPQKKECYWIDFVCLRSNLDSWKNLYRTVATSPELNAGYRTHGILVPLQKLIDISFDVWSV